MKLKLTLMLTALLMVSVSAFEIDRERGFWSGLDAGRGHRTDFKLIEELVRFFKQENATTLVDFGCGMGKYVHLLNKHGFDCEGYDGNPNTPELTHQLCKVLDLSKTFDFGKKYDWVMSLEVGEHIPKPFEKIFVENLIRHCDKGIVLSWAKKGQRGRGHFNNQNNDYVKRMMDSYGFDNDEDAENLMREASSLYWFKDTIMVFRKR